MNKNDLYISNLKKFSLLIDILDDFFLNKKYQKKKFLKEIKDKIFIHSKIKIDNHKLFKLLLNYHKYGHYFEKVKNLK
jgi:hypothetical protein